MRHMADAELVDHGVGFGTEAGLTAREHAAGHGALMFLRGDDEVVAHAHFSEHLQCLKSAADAALAELQRAQASDVLAV